MTRGWFALFLFVAASAPGCRSTKEKAVKPHLAAATSKRTTPRAPERPRTETFTYWSNGASLTGYVTKPLGAGPFPAFVYAHGGEPRPGSAPPVRDFFVANGFAFFVPLRHGYGPNPGPYPGALIRASGGGRDTIEMVEYEKGAEDVTAAIAAIKRLPYVDRGRIAVGGCSLGGIQALFAAARGDGPRVAIDWAGQSSEWVNVQLRQRLLRAVGDAKMPIFFLQAANDYTTQPTEVFGREAERKRKVSQKKIYPAHGTTQADGHGGFCYAPKVWGADVLAFIRAHNARR